MYNILVIIVCVLSVYGAYAVIREIALAFFRKKQIVAAVRVCTELSDAIALAETYTQKYTYFEKKAVLLCDTEIPSDIELYGMDVYIRMPERSARDRKTE